MTDKKHRSDKDGQRRARRDYAWAMVTLGALFSTPALISLIQHGFNIHLNWGFSHLVEFYRGFITPIIDMVESPVRWLLDWQRVEWVIPQWLKDLHALSFIAAGLAARGWGFGAFGSAGLPAKQSAEQSRDFLKNELESPTSTVPRDQLVQGIAHFRRRTSFSWSAYESIFVILRTVALGASFVGLLFWTVVPWSLGAAVYYRLAHGPFGRVRREDLLKTGRRTKGSMGWMWVRVFWVRFANLFVAALATAVAVCVFYVANALLPQLGFH